MKKAIFILIVLIWGGRSLSAQSTVTHDMTMWTTGQHTMWDGDQIRYYGFGPGFLVAPQFPGPILYANEGDSVIVNVRNQSQQAPHTIHWHGLDVDQANDGVPNTSFTIHHLEDTSYNFRAPHAGTYLYHCHVASVIHVQMGMYGVFVVKPADGSNRAWTGGPAFHKDYTWLMSEFDRSWHDTIPVHYSAVGDSVLSQFQIPAYKPDYFMVNGRSEQQLMDTTSTAITGQAGMKIWLRLANVGFYENLLLFPSGSNPEVLTSDGRVLPQKEVGNSLRIMPGERYGVMLNPLTEFSDSIAVIYRDMNNQIPADTQWIHIDLEGFVSRDPGLVVQPKLNIWPNPSDGRILLSWSGFSPETGNMEVELLDLQGRRLARKGFVGGSAGSQGFNFGAMPRGIAMLRIKKGSLSASRKIFFAGQ